MGKNLFIAFVLIGAVIGATNITFVNLLESIIKVFAGVFIAFMLISILSKVIE